MPIHATAIIAPQAEIDASVTVGPYAVIEKGVTIHADTEIKPHTVITGPTTIGTGNVIGPFATIGAPPQDLKYKGEDTELIIGNNNHIREYVSIHRGTVTDKGVTRIGDNNLLMGTVHVAHDCVLGNSVILANGAALAGHVQVDDHAIIGGLVAVQQFSRIGAHCYIGGMSGISMDVPPFVIVTGTRKDMRASGINKIGLRRCGFDTTTIKKLDRAYKIIFMTPSLLLQEALDQAVEELPDCEPVTQLVDFFRTSKQGVVRSTNGG